MEPDKWPPGKGDPYQKQSFFSGSMLNFGGVVDTFFHDDEKRSNSSLEQLRKKSTQL